MIADAEGYAGYRMGAVSNKKKGIASCELSLLHFAIWSAVRIPVVVRQSNYCSKIDGNCVSYPSHRWILTYRRIHHHSRVKLFGEEVPTSSQIPIVLLYGPPGSGKSFAMRMLAAQSGLQPWELKATALQERTREPVAVFQTILERMGRMENAIVYVDECEVLFPSREVMGNYASVDVRGHRRILAAFLTWVQGLAERRCGSAERHWRFLSHRLVKETSFDISSSSSSPSSSSKEVSFTDL